MTAVPPAAVTAARKAFARPAMSNVHAMEAALAAAASLIAAAATAAERERIRQLATDHDAAITKDCECGPHRGRFADLLEGDTP